MDGVDLESQQMKNMIIFPVENPLRNRSGVNNTLRYFFSDHLT